ncbi:hypothetical protein Taro_003219, partial [Colocasia esculenta]|nr:hypothetical protein [Colocasia esculenta]
EGRGEGPVVAAARLCCGCLHHSRSPLLLLEAAAGLPCSPALPRAAARGAPLAALARPAAAPLLRSKGEEGDRASPSLLCFAQSRAGKGAPGIGREKGKKIENSRAKMQMCRAEIAQTPLERCVDLRGEAQTFPPWPSSPPTIKRRERPSHREEEFSELENPSKASGKKDCKAVQKNGHNSAMAAATHTPGVFFGPLVVQDHIRNGYLTTPTRFGAFPPVVESPYFLGVILVVLPTAAKAHETKQAKEEPQAQEANLMQMFTTYAINFTNTPTTGKNRKRKSGKKPTIHGISSSEKTVSIGELRIRLDGSETMMIPERHVATIPVRNKFGILPKVQRDKPSLKVKEVKKQRVKAKAKNHHTNKFGFKKYRANVGKNEIYSPPRIKQVWVTKEEAQELRKTKARESLVGRKNARIMKQDPTIWQTFRRRRVPEREREPSQESRTKECTPSVPVDLQKGSKRKGVYKERRQASLETGQNFKSEEHKRDDDVPRKSVFQRLGATVRPRQKKRRTVQITEEGMRIYTCYASNINLPAIANQAETSNMEQHPTISNRRREQARAWLDWVNVEVDLPHQNEEGIGAADIATTSNHPLDQGRPVENPNIRVPSSPNLEMVMQENQKLKAMLESLMQQLGMAAPLPPQQSPPVQPPEQAQQILQPQQLQQASQPALPTTAPAMGNLPPSIPCTEPLAEQPIENPNSSHGETQEVHVTKQKHDAPQLNTSFEGTMVSQMAMIEQIIEAKMAEQNEGSAIYDLAHISKAK